MRLDDMFSDDHNESPSATYLALLAGGASAEAYERPVLRARADGEAPARLAAVERAKG
ncbi:hypothetical protein [Streptomyces syringium]|uniref:hypothetical protein n=1 Tax=Streptomyces syringium TaxID=76729 RepID=UPI0037CD62E6